MKLREYFDGIDLTEIDRFISDKQEENISLEFKTVNHPEYNDNNREFDKNNISEVLSGFANSNGGIIIWGIKAKNNVAGQDVAKDKKPIKELTKFLNLLNRLEGQAVTPPIIGIVHEKIEISEDFGFIKSFVPQSENAPHMANFSGKHYYKRSGDSFYQCEHYDIIDMFSRKKSPNLTLAVKILGKETRHQTWHRFKIMLSLVNNGTTIAKYPYLALNLTEGYLANEYGLDGNGNCGLFKVKNNVFYNHNYSGGLERVIYPGAKLDVDIFYGEVPINEVPHDLTIDYMISAENMESVKEQKLITKMDLLNQNCV